MKKERTPAGPAMKVAAPLALLVPAVVGVAVVWGLDWRWLITAALVMLAAVLAAGAIDEVILRRRRHAREAQLCIEMEKALKNNPMHVIGDHFRTTFQPKDPTA